jgi:hypothetical protein
LRRNLRLKSIAESNIGLICARAPAASRTPRRIAGELLRSASAEPKADLVKAFCKGLFDAGCVEGQNVNVKVIATPGSTPAALAAKATATTIPIVFAAGGDLTRCPIMTQSGNNPDVPKRLTQSR